LKLLALLGALALTVSAGEPPALEEILQKNEAARGGAAAWAKVTSLKIVGSYESFSRTAPFTLWRQRPDLYRFDHHLNLKPVTVAYDGARAWWKNDLARPGAKPAPMPPPLDKVVLRDKMFEPLFVRAGEKGLAIAFEGADDLDGEPHYVLAVTFPDGANERWFLHAETFLETKVRGKTSDFGREVIYEAFFSDYREVDGVTLPFLVEEEFHTRYRVTAVEEVSINPALDKALFALPEE